MRLPTYLPNTPEDKRILGEFYDIHAKKQWFDMALIEEPNQNNLRKTLVVHTNYNPAFEQKDILEFVHKYNLGFNLISNQNS
jgi:hypothetical protein